MVRERTSNRVFPDAHIIHPPPGDEPLLPARYFPATHRLEVDVGCGRGRFLLARARQHPGTNFLGIDQFLLRLRKIDRRAVQENLGNIRLIKGNALHVLSRLPSGSVSACYVFFPDPWPKRRHHRRRLVSRHFADLMVDKLAPRGQLHLCTDHPEYFAAMMAVMEPDRRFRIIAPFVPTDEEETDFGLLFRRKNLSINRCSFEKDGEPGANR